MPDRTVEQRSVDYYVGLPYAIELRQYEDGAWFAAMPELPGCMTEADTVEEVLVMVRDAQRAWLEVALEGGHPIPEPEPPVVYSGHLRVIMPRALHRKLADRARRERTDLNDFVVSLLRRGVEEPQQSAARRRYTRRAPAPPAEVREQ